MQEMSSLCSMNRHARSLISLFNTKPNLLSSSYSLHQRCNGFTTRSNLPGTGEVDSSSIKNVFQSFRAFEITNLGTHPCGSHYQSSRRLIHSSAPEDAENGRISRAMDYVRGIIEEDVGIMGGSRYPRSNVEQEVDFVHIKLMRNNTFVTVTDSKGNKKIGASAGCLPEMKGGPKMSRYAAEATAEHVGRMCRSLGLKSVVMRVKGFTHFKKKRQAIMSWREGFSGSRSTHSPIVYIEDSTRRAHNGCRLPKRRRV